MLKIFNTLTKKKEKFIPINSGNINIYVCGTTVYDFCHIGHARTFIAFDVIIRYFKYKKFKVNYIRNITDIENNIIERANKNSQSFHDFTNIMIKEMHYDFKKLNIISPNYEPRATNHIDLIIKFINKLLKKDYAYISDNGDVIFSVDKYKNYGNLSNQNIKKLKSGYRINISKNKKNPLDFILWKSSKIGEPGWLSPWNYGRPGWHIECSAINCHYLGHHFDIHGGGSDLIFPHHENEIAQSVCVYNEPYVNTWMHTGMVMINNEKMSKSLKNFVKIREIIKYYNSETIRYFLMSSHYRSAINYNIDNLKKAESSLERLYSSLRDLKLNFPYKDEGDFIKNFNLAMDDDFNTPKAYSLLFEISHDINIFKNKKPLIANNLGSILFILANVLGLLKQNPNNFLQKKFKNNKNFYFNIDKLIKKRNKERSKKQWILADKTRDKLIRMGVSLEDNKNGTKWKKN